MPGPFTYLNTIPQPTDLLSVSQGNFLTNFGSIKSFVDIDHVSFASVDAGKHKQVTFPVQAVAPVFLAGEYGLYNKNDGANNQLYLSNNMAALQVPISSGNIPSVGASGFQNGFSYFGSGFLVKWGPLTAIPANAATVIAFPVVDFGGQPMPAFNVMCSGAVITNISGGAPSQVLSVQAVTTTTITVYNNGGIASGFFIAIGY